MKYLGSERSVTQDFKNHIIAEDYSGFHKSDVKINGSGKVIKVINKYRSYEDSIDYNNFLVNQNLWYKNGVYNCISITGKLVIMSVLETGGNQIWIETYDNGIKLIFRLCHLDSVLVDVGDIVDSDTVLGFQGNTGLVSSSKSITDVTYGSHVHFEVTKNDDYINPRKFATGEIITTYIGDNSGIDNTKDQIKILVKQINIREKTDETSNDLGDVYYGEYYNVLEIIEKEKYVWYKITTRNGITGYVAASKNENWIEYIKKEVVETVELDNDNGIDNTKDQIKILVKQINIREKTDETSNDLGDVYYGEYYNVLEIIEKEKYVWYKITTRNGITGYVAASKNENWIEYIKKESTSASSNLKLIFTCEKTGQYIIKLYSNEKLYIEK